MRWVVKWILWKILSIYTWKFAWQFVSTTIPWIVFEDVFQRPATELTVVIKFDWIGLWNEESLTAIFKFSSKKPEIDTVYLGYILLFWWVLPFLKHERCVQTLICWKCEYSLSSLVYSSTVKAELTSKEINKENCMNVDITSFMFTFHKLRNHWLDIRKFSMKWVNTFPFTWII